MKWSAHGIVTVNRDKAQMENGSGTQYDITTGMDFAEDVTKVPARVYRPRHTVWHHREAEQKVCGCHGADENVGWGMELFEVENGDNHKHIPTQGEQYGPSIKRYITKRLMGDLRVLGHELFTNSKQYCTSRELQSVVESMI